MISSLDKYIYSIIFRLFSCIREMMNLENSSQDGHFVFTGSHQSMLVLTFWPLTVRTDICDIECVSLARLLKGYKKKSFETYIIWCSFTYLPQIHYRRSGGASWAPPAESRVEPRVPTILEPLRPELRATKMIILVTCYCSLITMKKQKFSHKHYM